jgi:hypothetical protein
MNPKFRLCLKAFAALMLAVAFSGLRAAYAQGAGSVLILEFRYQGPGGNNDEYIELYNNTDAPISISGWGIYDETGASVRVLAAGAVIPARGHYLVVKQGAQYCMAAYGPPDDTYTSALANDRGIGLFRDNIADAAHRIDSVGTVNTPAGLYREGAGLPALGNTGKFVEYAWVRKMPYANGGIPLDTGDNASDFMLVSTNALYINGVMSALGSPGPEGMASPSNMNNYLLATLLDPNVAVNLPPNRVRDYADVGPNNSLGTMLLRRTNYNFGTKTITKLRFRVTEVTTMHSPLYTTAAQADVRLLDSVGLLVPTSLGNVNVKGATVDTPANGMGSGYNASVVTLIDPLVPCNGNTSTLGCSVSIQFKLGVEVSGYFRFYTNVDGIEAAPLVRPAVRRSRR